MAWDFKYVHKFTSVLGGILDKISPLTFFVLTSLLFGLIFIFITPPAAGLDEEQHFYRAYQVSDFNLIADKVYAPNVYGEKGSGYGGYLPKSVFKVINKLRNSMNIDKSYQYHQIRDNLIIDLKPNDKMAVRFDNTAIYSPVPYLPQAFGINIGKSFNANPVILSYLGRLMSLVFWIVMMYLAIRIAPIGKWVFIILALNPASLFLASSLSSDTISISIVAIFVAIVMKLNLMKRRLPTKFYLIVFMMIILIALLKNVYLPIIFLLLTVPHRVINLRLKIVAILLGIIIGFLWNYAILSIAVGIPHYFSIYQHISAHEQLLFIAGQPLHFLCILLWNIFGTPSVILSQGFAGYVSDTVLPFWLPILWFGTLVFAFLTKEVDGKSGELIEPKLRWTSAIVAIIAILSTVTTLYLGWNEVGSRNIIGIHPRYFIPISFLLIPIFLYLFKPIHQIKIKNYDSIIKIIIFVILFSTAFTMAVRYIYGIL